jgi:hypothetical protein
MRGFLLFYKPEGFTTFLQMDLGVNLYRIKIESSLAQAPMMLTVAFHPQLGKLKATNYGCS